MLTAENTLIYIVNIIIDFYNSIACILIYTLDSILNFHFYRARICIILSLNFFISFRKSYTI